MHGARNGRGSAAWAEIGRDDAPITAHAITARHAIARSAPLLEAAKLFHAAPDLRMLPVIDDHERPIGALFERDIRELLFSPFGYALLCNKSLAMGLDRYLAPCVAVELGTGIGAALDAWAAQGSEGLVVTRNGRFEGVIDQVSLLRIAADRDAAIGAVGRPPCMAIDRKPKFMNQVRDRYAGRQHPSKRSPIQHSSAGQSFPAMPEALMPTLPPGTADFSESAKN